MLTRAASPALWARVDGLCRRLGTAPATHIVGGVDDNFFVTEHPVHLGPHVLTGRTLFVSLSLLKRLDRGEADAVLAHEMAHFSGGDTEYSKRTSPLLARFRTYLGALHEGGLSWPVFNFMLLYWSLVQLALSASSRAAGDPRRSAGRRRDLAGVDGEARCAGWPPTRRTAPASKPASSVAMRNTRRSTSAVAWRPGSRTMPAARIWSRTCRRDRSRIRSTATRRWARACRRWA